MTLRYYSADDIRRALPMRRAIDTMRAAFCALHAGKVTMPVRLQMPTPDGVCLFMPAHIAAHDGRPAALGQKVVNVFGDNRARRLPVINAIVLLFDAQTGVPTTALEGTTLTALRTGAVSGLATELLAPRDARVLTIFGAGAQAAYQIEAVCAVRPIQQINIISKMGDSARLLAAWLQNEDASRRYIAAQDIETAVRGADVITTSTNSTAPLFDGAWVKVGTHINAIGAYRRDMIEVDATLIRRAAVYVDDRAAALEEAGDLLQPIERGEWSAERVVADLGELASGAVSIAADASRITFFKSCGLAVEDVAAAMAVAGMW